MGKLYKRKIELRNHFGVFFLTLAVVLIGFLNYTPGTWLTGWDNLHPEFNFPLNIKRSIFAAWQEYQGLGLLGGMGHASDLPRQIFLWLVSLILPTHLLRYFYHFLMLFLGPLGTYFLLKKIILRRYGKNEKEIASLIGAIFYLFNLATLQMFYVPFEPSSTHFAFLPWLFFANLNFLNKGDKKNLLLLLLINLFSVPQGYVGTSFLVYLIALSLVSLFYFFQKRRALKKILVAYLILFVVNAFWLLPNLYFVATNTDVNLSAKINQMANENNILKNKKYGNLSNTAILKGFWFDNAEVDETGEMNFMMGDWVSHLENPLILSVGYLIFLFSILGFIFASKKGVRGALLFLPVFLLSFAFLANDTPVFSYFTSLFYKIPLLYQIFRFPYTKFAIMTAFCLSIFYSVAYLSLSVLSKKPFLKIVLMLIFAFLPIIFLYPVFAGKLFYFKNRANIPFDYFQVIDFFKTQDKSGRIANFPQYTFWGWAFYNWHYGGSGFLWYGIEQPVLDRAFDPWSNKNENYYWEIAYALYSENRELFEKVLEKYQIDWLLFDGNIISPFSPKALYLDELEQMLSSSNKVSLSQEFGKIKIYQVDNEVPVKDFVFLAQNLPMVEPKYNWNNYDVAYLENGSYISPIRNSKLEIGNLTYYPFRSLFSGKNQEDLEFEIEDGGDHFIFRQTLPETLQGYHLEIPETKEELIWVDPNNLSRVRYLSPEVYFDGRTVKVIVPKVGGYYSAEINPASDPEVLTAKNCDQLSQGKVENEIIKEDGKNFLRLTSVDANNCLAFWLPNLPHKIGYLITVESQSREGKSLLFWLENPNIRKADIETNLPKERKLTKNHFIQPPMEQDGLGYALHFVNLSIGRVDTVNDLGKVTVNPIPFNFLTSLRLVSSQLTGDVQESAIIFPEEVTHPNPSFYQINTGTLSDRTTLVLSQSFNQGWQAFRINGKSVTRIKSHVLVNNWANGWQLEGGGSKRIIVIFLPQLLEYLGFFLLLILVALLLIF